MTYRKTTILIPAYQPGVHMVSLVHILSRTGFEHILIVNDGSDESCNPFFEEAAKWGAHIINHDRNRGKGAALKTGIQAARELYPSDIGIVTADADGQHLPSDIMRIADGLRLHPDSLILGVRNFSGSDVPWKSRTGNRITAAFFRMSTGIRLADTQTGLRGIPQSLYDLALSTKGERYEYEMHFLEDCVSAAPLVQIPIATVYEDGNSSSHFRPVRDSARVYSRPLKFVTISLSCSILDLALFYILMLFLPYEAAAAITTATVIARILSCILNFGLNRKWCFRSKESVTKTGFRYTVLVFIQMGLSAAFVTLISPIFANTLIAKIIVDVALSVFSYYAQKFWVFRRKEERHGRYTDSVQTTT